MATPPIDVNSAREFQQMKCESLATDDERETCYSAKIKEMTDAQEKAAIIRASVGGSIGIVVSILLIVGIYFLFLRKPKIPAPVKEVMKEVISAPAPTS